MINRGVDRCALQASSVWSNAAAFSWGRYTACFLQSQAMRGNAKVDQKLAVKRHDMVRAIWGVSQTPGQHKRRTNRLKANAYAFVKGPVCWKAGGSSVWGIKVNFSAFTKYASTLCRRYRSILFVIRTFVSQMSGRRVFEHLAVPPICAARWRRAVASFRVLFPF